MKTLGNFKPTHVKSWLIGKDPDAGRDLGQEEKGTTEWDSWMASPTGWTWVWVNSGSWWWTGRPGMLRFIGSQRVGYNWVTELNWTDWKSIEKNTCTTKISLKSSKCKELVKLKIEYWHNDSQWRYGTKGHLMVFEFRWERDNFLIHIFIRDRYDC